MKVEENFKTTEKEIYVIKTPRIIQLIVLAVAVFVSYYVIFQFDLLIALWSGGTIIFKLAMIVAIVGTLIGCLEVFLTRLEFTTNYIAYRNIFFVTTYKAYKDVAQIEYLAGTYLTIKFTDNSKRKLRVRETVARKIHTIISSQAGKKVILIWDD